MVEIIMAIALLCQATSGDVHDHLKHVRADQAVCQQRLLKCMDGKKIFNGEALKECVVSGAVYDK